MWLCLLFLGFCGYFFSLASFFWLNVIYFDLMKSIVNRENHFVTYLAYGWGIPAALTSVLLILQNSSLTERYKPGIGDTSCWFSGKNFEIRNNTKFLRHKICTHIESIPNWCYIKIRIDYYGNSMKTPKSGKRIQICHMYH